MVCQAWWELCLARSSSAFCLPQPILPPHHCSSWWMQFFQAYLDCHSCDHALTHFSQNEPAYFKQFMVRFRGSFRWSQSPLLPLPLPIPSSVFPSFLLCWHFAVSHTERCHQGCFWLYRLRVQWLSESVSGLSTFVERAVTEVMLYFFLCCFFLKLKKACCLHFFTVLQFVLITPLYTNFIVYSCKKLSCH